MQKSGKETGWLVEQKHAEATDVSNSGYGDKSSCARRLEDGAGASHVPRELQVTVAQSRGFEAVTEGLLVVNGNTALAIGALILSWMVVLWLPFSCWQPFGCCGYSGCVALCSLHNRFTFYSGPTASLSVYETFPNHKNTVGPLGEPFRNHPCPLRPVLN